VIVSTHVIVISRDSNDNIKASCYHRHQPTTKIKPANSFGQQEQSQHINLKHTVLSGLAATDTNEF
jgi:hypothetical protein